MELDLGALLAAVEDAPPIDALDVLASELARHVGAAHVALLIANFSGTALVRLSHVEAVDGPQRFANRDRREALQLPGSIHEQVLQSQRPEFAADGDRWLVLLPVTERGDAIGLLELTLPARPDPTTLECLEDAAHALAYLLVASRRHTDLFEWAQRDLPFSVPAEIQRRLLPSAYTVEGGAFTLSGWLEPASDVGGDTFDYSLDRDHLYVSITDAMGHSTDAALLATLTVAALRNARRSLAGPAAQADAANAQLVSYSGGEQFVTGLLMRVSLADGHAEIVNAGHPHPFLIRQGRAVELHLPTCLPLGIGDAPYTAESLQLHPGDRLVMVTDGYLERNAARLDIDSVLTATRGRHPRQVVQELSRNVLDATGGSLRDDATVVCVDWYGPSGRRDATAGASRARTTLPSKA